MSSVTDGQEFASIGGDFSLTAGESLQIAVGGAGLGGDGSGSGGGSFVVGPGNTPLVLRRDPDITAMLTIFTCEHWPWRTRHPRFASDRLPEPGE